MRTRCFPGVKRPGHNIYHTPPSSADAKERVQLYIYSPSGPSWLLLGWTLCSHIQMHQKKKSLEIHFIYLGNKEVHWIFKICCIVSVFSPNAVYFTILSFSVQVIFTFFINHSIQFRHQTIHLKLKPTIYRKPYLPCVYSCVCTCAHTKLYAFQSVNMKFIQQLSYNIQ